MTKKTNVFREGDAKYFKEYLTEAVRQVVDETSRGPDPEAVSQVKDWADKNGYEVVEKKKNVLVIKVPPQEVDGKKQDAREPVVRKMEADLSSLGFEHVADGSTVGKIVKRGVRGESRQLNVQIKPTVSTSGGGTAASAGSEAENKLAAYISEKYAGKGVSATTAGYGHGSDLKITAPGKEPMTIEVKTTLSADFGQFRIGYDLESKQWKPIKTKGFIKNETIFADIFQTVVAPLMNKEAYFAPQVLKFPNLNIKNNVITGLKPLKGTGDLKRALQSQWFGLTDTRAGFDFEKVSNYYASKGDKFIQIGRGKGLYGLDTDVASEIGIPYFGDSGLAGFIRMRIKPHSGYDGTHSFTVAIKLGGKLKPSPLDLTKEEDLDKIIARFLNT